MIAREGLHLIIIGLALTAVFIFAASRFDNKYLFGFSLILGVLTIFTIYFFRDPNRNSLSEVGILLAPADGKVLSIDTTGNFPFVGEQAVKVSIFLSVFDVHVNRVPAAGTIDYVKYNKGKFLAAFKDKASQDNEQTEIGMTSPSGHKVIFKQIAGLIARRIVCRLKSGDEVSAGDRFGLIRFGSRADIILPVGSEIRAKIGEHVTAGETVMGYLPAQTQSTIREVNADDRNVEI